MVNEKDFIKELKRIDKKPTKNKNSTCQYCQKQQENMISSKKGMNSRREERMKALERFMFCGCDGVEFSEEQKEKMKLANEMLLDLIDKHGERS